jgi:hypothetical protein
MDITTRDRNRNSAAESIKRITPRRLTWSAIVAEVVLAAPRLAWPEFLNPGLLFPVVVWPVMIYLALSWRNHPAAWRAAVRAAAPVVIVSWAMQALTLLV